MDSIVEHIPLNRLKASPENVRSTRATATIEELAASIAAHGLLQMPVVRPERDQDGRETGCYLVDVGESRRLALRLLAKRKHIKRSEPVACLVRTDGRGAEISLAENVVRTAMHPADQFEAFARLTREQGLGLEEIAARFGITPAVVRQRLKLAAVSPKLLRFYRAGELTLDQLMAFALTDDRIRQEQVHGALGWDRSPEMIRRLLTGGHASVGDRRVRFVGLEAYEAAGGGLLRDLFAEDDGGWLTDGELLDLLVREKLEAAAEEVRREGWKWVEAQPEYPYGLAQACRRIYPRAVPLPEEAEARLAELRARYEALAEGGGETEAAAAELETLTAEIAAVEARGWAYPPEKVYAGAIVALGQDGALRIERGFW
jgi:ParB family transcriptional regulator, chromosome partitioning protein